MIRLDDARIRAAEEVFRLVVELPGDQRAAALIERCGSDVEMRELVERLLRLDSDATQFADSALRLHPFREVGSGALFRRVGRYEILREIGRGGVGVVYHARQDHPNRDVALKLLRFAAPGPDTLRRFQLEAEALGQLNHPGIAHVYEAGVEEIAAPGGETLRAPFVAMELIRGQPLVEFAEERRLDTRARLELLAGVCDAIQHAHQKGVIHRDLKPANILVIEECAGTRTHEAAEEGDPRPPLPGPGSSASRAMPKIVDFGVARVANASQLESIEHTHPGQLIGTVAYMSPEQLSGNAQAVDTRSDVYSLGVVGYELLAGRPPIDISQCTLPQAIRTLAESDAPPAGALRRELKGDVSAILARAMERSAERRYSSAAEMAADIRRFLRSEPITARPPTVLYQISRFARRNRTLVASAALLAVTVLAASGWTTWAMLRAQQESSRAAALNQFLQEIIAAADPATGRADVRLVEVLRRAANDAQARFADHPETEAEVRTLLARAFSNMSLFDEALVHATRALELLRATRGAAHPATIAIAVHRADVLKRAQRFAESRRAAEDVLALLPRDERDSPAALEARRTIAVCRATDGDADAAEAEFRDVLRAAHERLGPGHTVTLASTNDLAWFLSARAIRGASHDRARDATEASDLFEQALPAHVARHGEASYPTLNLMANLAQALLLTNQFERAGRMAERVLSLAPERFGEDNALCQRARTALAQTWLAQGRFEPAADLALANVRSIERLAGGRENPVVLSEMSDVLPILDAGGRLREGEEFARLLHEAIGGMGGHGGGLALRYQVDTARFVSRQGRLDEADELFRPILSATDAAREMDLAARIDLAYGAHLTQRGSLDEAERRLISAEQNRWLVPGEQIVAWQELVRLYEAKNQPEQAARWREMLTRHAAQGSETSE